MCDEYCIYISVVDYYGGPALFFMGGLIWFLVDIPAILRL